MGIKHIKNIRGMMLVFGIVLSLVLSLFVLFIADTIRIFTIDANRTAVKVTLNVAVDNVKKYHSCCDIYSLYFGGAVPNPLSIANFTTPAILTVVGFNNVLINNYTSPYEVQGYVDAGYSALRLRVQNTLAKELHQRSIASWVDLSSFTGMGNFDFCAFAAHDYRSTSAYCMASATTGSSSSSSSSVTTASSSSSSTTVSSSSSSSVGTGSSSSTTSSSSSSTGGSQPRSCNTTDPQYCSCPAGQHCVHDQICVNKHGAFCTCTDAAATCQPDDSCSTPIINCGAMCVCSCVRTNFDSCSFNCCCNGPTSNWCFDTPGNNNPTVSPPDYGGGCGAGAVRCFGAGTLVKTPQGPKAIETLKVGDTVTSYDFESKKLIDSQVTRNFASEATEFMYIKFEGGVFPRVTPEHPFFSMSRNKWVNAQDLKQNEELLLNEHSDLKTSRVLFLDRYKDLPTTVYNLEVDSTHNYFANDILVHNKICRTQLYTCAAEIGCAIGFICGNYNGYQWIQQIDNSGAGCGTAPYPCYAIYTGC